MYCVYLETRVLWALLADKMLDRQHGASRRKLMTDVSSGVHQLCRKGSQRSFACTIYIVACEQTLWPTKKSRNSQSDW